MGTIIVVVVVIVIIQWVGIHFINGANPPRT